MKTGYVLLGGLLVLSPIVVAMEEELCANSWNVMPWLVQGSEQLQAITFFTDYLLIALVSNPMFSGGEKWCLFNLLTKEKRDMTIADLKHIRIGGFTNNPDELVHKLRTLSIDEIKPGTLAVDSSGRLRAEYTADGKLDLYQTGMNSLIWEKTVGTNRTAPDDLAAHLFFSNDGNFLVLQIGTQKLLNDPQQLLIMKANTGSSFKELWLPNTAKQVVLSPQNRYLLVDDTYDGKGSVWVYSLEQLLLKDFTKGRSLASVLRRREING